MDILVTISEYLGYTSSAAADGVGALKSDTKSQIVKSVSCPTADTIGIFDLKISRAKFPSLNPNKSSKEPPPRAIIITSTFASSLKVFIPFHN